MLSYLLLQEDKKVSVVFPRLVLPLHHKNFNKLSFLFPVKNREVHLQCISVIKHNYAQESVGELVKNFFTIYLSLPRDYSH